MSHDVFISYSSKDKAIADAVCAKLESHKIRCWIAPRDILPGVPYAQALVDAIKKSQAIVLVLSSHSNVSPQVMREIERAVSFALPIIPLRIEDILPSESMEYYLSSVHWLDALTRPIEGHLDRLADTVERILGKVPAEVKVLPSQAPVTSTVAPEAVETAASTVKPSIPQAKTVRSNRNVRLLPFVTAGVALLAVIAFVVWGVPRLTASPAPTSTSFETLPFVVTSTNSPTLLPTETTESFTETMAEVTSTSVIGQVITQETQVSPTDGMVLASVPAGNFTMGSLNDFDENPVHSVLLDAYWIDQTEVTNSMYSLCVQAGACVAPTKNSSATHTSYFDNPEFADFPVIYVTWDNAKAYCEWAGRRLPTEAEWEKAARGVDDRNYPWGNQTPDKTLLNYLGVIGDVVKVGSYPTGASPYGTLDMAGNVWEWVSDWYDSAYYKVSPSSNPTGPTDPSFFEKVMRGGAWYIYMGNLDVRVSTRGMRPSYYSDESTGFRCVLPAK